MSKALLSSLLLLVAGCSGSVEPTSDGIPVACRQQAVRSFVHGTATCEPAASETCAFDAHNRPTPLDSSGDPLAYYCVCGENSLYTCWSAPGLAAAEPLP